MSSLLRARLLAGLEVRERRLQLAGAATSVLEAGAGRPLVLLHGGIECGGVYWAPVIERLATRWRVVVPDVPGLGESEPFDSVDVDSFAAWLTALVEERCAEPPVLVAHSLLGSYAARFAAGGGGELERLLVYGAPGIGAYRMPLGLLVAAIRADLRPSERNQERFLPWPFLDPERTRARDPEWFAAFISYMSACGAVPHTKTTMRRLIKTATKRIPDEELRVIDVPAALLWGRHDRMAPVGLAEEAHRRLGWPLEVVENAGHVPHIEQPEAFVRALDHLLGQTNQRRAA